MKIIPFNQSKLATIEDFKQVLRVKKAGEQLGINYYTIADWRKARSQKAKEERIASDKTPLNERELAY